MPAAGTPAKQLAELAERIDADLIVLGSRGHAPLAGVVLGSVTQQLLHATGRPVLALPPTRVCTSAALFQVPRPCCGVTELAPGPPDRASAEPRPGVAQLQRRRTSVASDQSSIS